MAKDSREETESQDTQVAEPPKKLKMKLIIIIAAALVVLLAAGGGGWYFLSKSPPDKHETKEQKPLVVSVWPMEAFIVNVADSNGDRYLKLVVQLEVSDPSTIAELDQLKPRLRDSILDLLTSKPYKDLIDPAGKQRLREDIAGRVNNALTKGKVTKVYFTEFVMQ
jgi:flagellar FliL protein